MEISLSFNRGNRETLCSASGRRRMNLNQGAEFRWLAVNNIVMLCMVDAMVCGGGDAIN